MPFLVQAQFYTRYPPLAYTVCFACAFAFFSCASLQDKRVKSLAKIDPKIAQQYEHKRAPSFIKHKGKGYIWHINSLKYQDTSIRGVQKALSQKESTQAPSVKKPASLSPKLLALKKIAPTLAQKYQKQKKEPPNALKYNAKLYLWDIDTGKYLSSKKKLSLKAKPPPLVKKAPPLISKTPALPQGDAQLEKDTVKPEKPDKGLQAAPVPPIAVLPLPSAPIAAIPALPLPSAPIAAIPALPLPSAPIAAIPVLPLRSAPIAAKKQKKAAVIKKSNNKGYASYEQMLVNILAPHLGAMKAWSLIIKIDITLKKFSSQDNDTADFIRKAYKKYYRKIKHSAEVVRKMLSKGLALDRSLHAVVKYVREQFEKGPISVYALSKIMGTARLEAKLLLEKLK